MIVLLYLELTRTIRFEACDTVRVALIRCRKY